MLILKRVIKVLLPYLTHTNTQIPAGVNVKQPFIVKFHLNRLSKEKKKKDMTGTDSSIVGGVCVVTQLLHNQHMQVALDWFHAVLLHMSQFSRIHARVHV